MTKSPPTGSIKMQKKVQTLREFDLMIQRTSDEDSIGHLFIVDFEFDQKNAILRDLYANF